MANSIAASDQLPVVSSDFAARTKQLQPMRQLFADASWIAVMLGQGVQPQRWDPLADIMPLAELQQKAQGLRSRLHQAVARMPTHRHFIDNNCKAA